MIHKLSNDDFNGLFGSLPDGHNNPIYNDVLFAQMLLESSNPATANGMSELYTEHNNLFGMKPSQKREKLWSDKVQYGSETFATYVDASGSQSLLDRVDLDIWNKTSPPQTVSEILAYMSTVLAKGYATDPNYLKKWRSVLLGVNPILYKQIAVTSDEMKKKFNFGWFFKGFGLVVTGILGYYLYKKFLKK